MGTRPTEWARPNVGDEERRGQYRIVADLSIEAARLQRHRVLNPNFETRSRHDIDFYVFAVARLAEVVHRAAKTGYMDRAALDCFEQRWPAMRRLRNALIHPEAPGGDLFMVWWLDSSMVQALPGGSVKRLVDVARTHEDVEVLYQAVCSALPRH